LLILEGDKRKNLRATVNSRQLLRLNGKKMRIKFANTRKFLRLLMVGDLFVIPNSRSVYCWPAHNRASKLKDFPPLFLSAIAKMSHPLSGGA